MEYHTSIIQSIEIVKRPLLFNQHDNDKSSRFFSSSSTTVTKTSVFDALTENRNVILNKEEISPRNENSNKRFKRLHTEQEDDHPPQLNVQSSIDAFLTPTKQNRIVLKRKSPNIEKEPLSTDKSDIITSEQESDNRQV